MQVFIIQIDIPQQFLKIVCDYLDLRKISYSVESWDNTLGQLNIYDASLEQINTINQIIKN